MYLAWVKILGEAARIMLLAVILAGAAILFRPALKPLLTGDQTTGPESVESPEGRIPSITIEDARSYFDSGQALFADARSQKVYRMGHIKGAMSLDPSDFDAWSGKFFSQFAPETLIITYCDGARCPLSMELAEKLVEMGYENVFVLKDGWHQWTTAHLPTEQTAE